MLTHLDLTSYVLSAFCSHAQGLDFGRCFILGCDGFHPDQNARLPVLPLSMGSGDPKFYICNSVGLCHEHCVCGLHILAFAFQLLAYSWRGTHISLKSGPKGKT